jgi:hypothetical protein
MKAKTRRGSPFGGKRIVDKVTAALRHVSQAERAMLGKEFAAELAQIGYSDPDATPEDWTVEDRRDLKVGLLGLSAVQQVMGLLDGMPGTNPLVEVISSTHEHFTPGGPPISPVHDSLWVGWSSVDLRVGKHRETAAEVAREVLPMLGLGSAVLDSLDRVMASRLGIYRIVEPLQRIVGGGDRYRVRELVTNRELVVQTLEEFDPFLPQDLLLLRPIAATEEQARERQVSHMVVATPYVLRGRTEPEWLDYFEREATKISKGRLTPSEYEALMRGAGDPAQTRWLEYVMDGYAGTEPHNVVILEGIPDRPETLPHHEEFDEADAYAIPPGATAKERGTVLSRRVASNTSLLMRRAGKPLVAWLAGLGERLVADGGDDELWNPLLMPACIYLRTPGGPALVSRIAEVMEVDADLREWLDAAQAARVSVFEVLRVVEGERMTMRDLLDGREFDVVERSASLNLPPRSLLIAMLVCYRQVWTIEGLYAHALSPGAREALVASLRPLTIGGGLDLERLDEIVLACHHVEADLRDRTRRELATATMVTTTGERIRPTRLVLDLGDNSREAVLAAVSRLQRCEHVDQQDRGGEQVDTFMVATTSGATEAQILVTGSTVEIEALALERARKVAGRIKTKLSHTLAVIAEQQIQGGPPRERTPPSKPELEALREFFRQHYAAFLDEPIPMLADKTPRQAAKLPRLRAKLDELLRQHEHGVAQQIGAGVVDFAAMRRTLGLDERV